MQYASYSGFWENGPNFTAPPFNSLGAYSNEEERVLQQAASILAVPISELPFSLQQLNVSLSALPKLSTSTVESAYACQDDTVGRGDLELVSPSSWRSESSIESNFSPEPTFYGYAGDFVADAAAPDKFAAFQEALHEEKQPQALPFVRPPVGFGAYTDPIALPLSSNILDSPSLAPNLISTTDAAPLMFGWEQPNQPKPVGGSHETELVIGQSDCAQVPSPNLNTCILSPLLPHQTPLSSAIDKPSGQRCNASLEDSIAEAALVPMTIPPPEVPEGGPSLSVLDNVDAYPTQPAGTNCSGASPDLLPPCKRPMTGTSMSIYTPKRRQAFKDLKKRWETGNTRKMGACVRCRLQRVRVGQILCRSAGLY